MPCSTSRRAWLAASWRALTRLHEQLSEPAEASRRQLAQTSQHAFSHTFGTQFAAAGMALEASQPVLSHESLQTTAIYENAE